MRLTDDPNHIPDEFPQGFVNHVLAVPLSEFDNTVTVPTDFDAEVTYGPSDMGILDGYDAFPPPSLRFILVYDNPGHAYYIPEGRRPDWEEWLCLDDDDERSWEEPDYATRIDGTFTFTDPRCD